MLWRLLPRQMAVSIIAIACFQLCAGFVPFPAAVPRNCRARIFANQVPQIRHRKPLDLHASLSIEPPKTLDKYKIEATGNMLATQDSGKVMWPQLNADRFIHPFDRQATAALKRLPFADTFVRDGFGSVVEQAIFLDNLSNSIRVGPKQLPHIYESLQEAKAILGLESAPIDVYVRQNPSPNAYTMAMQGKRPFIVIHSSLIELMSTEELQAVLAHELGHLKCEHGIWITFANIITIFASQLPGVGRGLAEALNMGTLRWLRAAEFSCDRASLLVAQLTGGAASFAKELNPDDYLRQAQDFEKESTNTWMKQQMRNSLTSTRSHPLPVERVRELDTWSKSAEYRALLAGGKPIKPPQTSASKQVSVKDAA